MNEELLIILENLEREKGIKKEILIEAVEAALISAVRRDMGVEVKDIQVKVNPKTGGIQVFSDGKEITSAKFGRIAAQTAKQVIIQKIREAERDVIFEDYHKKVNSLTMGSVNRFEKGNMVVDLGKTEAVLPRAEQMPQETYRVGDRVRAYILEVKKTSKGPHIVLSRTSAGFVKEMFELEVPEIYEKIVQIKSIAREAGERTKLAVYSNDEKIDCVGACVGMRGTRVKNIVRELKGEKIDIIRWNEDPKEFISGALSPAKVASIELDEKKKSARVVVDQDQLSLAIGKRGQNVRLACKLTGWDIDIKGLETHQTKEKTETKEEKVKEDDLTQDKSSLSGLSGVGGNIQTALIEAGFETVQKLSRAEISDLTQIKGLGTKKAEKIIAQAKEKQIEQ